MAIKFIKEVNLFQYGFSIYKSNVGSLYEFPKVYEEFFINGGVAERVER